MNGMPPGVRPLTVGDPVIIGRYLLLGRLGVGGMGVVYLAEHPQGGVVALKTPHPVHLHDPTLRARFAEEVEFSRRVVPFCTAAVVEDGTDRGRPYLVSEYIPGPALSQVVSEQGPLTPDLAYGAALGVAAALVAVHEAGLVHRDLKPGNVLLSDTGPRVIDFGIARDVGALATHTQAGQVMGSPGWVAPERLVGGSALPASDVFAWGCLIAYAATGHHPFGAGEPDAVARRIMVEPPRAASVPALLRPAVEACLAKDPAHRPRAADLLGALLAAGGVGAPRDLRVAVAEVLAEIWTPVRHPPEGGRAHPPSHLTGDGRPWHLSHLTGDGRPRRVSHPSADGAHVPASAGPVREPSAPTRGSRRAPRRSAHLSQASFAALATVSMAAVTVVAAGSGGGGGGGGGGVEDGSGTPGRVPVVIPVQERTADPASRAARPPGGRPRTTPVMTPSTVLVTATRTVSVPAADGEREEPRPGRSPGSDGPPGGGGPRTCADATAKGRGRGDDCPATPGSPKPSFTQIPQTGDGESPAPSPAPSVTAPTSPPPPGTSPSAQIGG
ncbi:MULTISPECIES: serine/threonine-protein kinase [Streptosporangium]|uniref:Serine/threonine protein kinase n=1 Tax=Streptosporangium brasiliense TaxID=47480 RepID=A0ABT9QZK0_9ACTN|nr:serine/threonine-protein kinase [Streptosporangium brasiliense]MDP9862382.1 serine/threonine protein kinase [Streptosporangium brasiliense]